MLGPTLSRGSHSQRGPHPQQGAPLSAGDHPPPEVTPRSCTQTRVCGIPPQTFCLNLAQREQQTNPNQDIFH